MVKSKIGWRLWNIGSFMCGLVLTSGVLSAKLSEAATYYVAKTGTDSHSCSQAQDAATPKLTVKSGFTCLTAGDTLIIKAGTYSEGTFFPPGGSSPTNRVTIKGAPGETVTLKGGTSGGHLISIQTTSQSYMSIEDLIVDADNFAKFAVNIRTANYIRLKNLVVKNARGSGLSATIGTNGSTTNFNEYINLRVHDNGLDCALGLDAGPCHGGYLGGEGHLVDGGEWFNNNTPRGKGINGYPWLKNTTIRNAKFYNNFFGFVVERESGNRIYNNLIWNNPTAGMRVSGANSVVYNNTLHNNADLGIYITGSGIAVRNNIVFGSNRPLLDGGSNTTLSNNFTTDPKFVNASALDFGLQSTSPAINAGMNLAPTVVDDFDRIARPQGSAYDIGAYEFKQSGLAAPTNLRVVSGD